MDIKKLQEPLGLDHIEFRVQSVSSKNKIGATVLAYKNARVDMQRLDDVVGPLNWKREHTRDNKNCIVSIYNEETKEWVSKEDTGTESNTEQAKGLASDSFKRACFNWGIGRELYDFPFIWIEMQEGEYYTKDGKYRASSSFMQGWTRELEHNDDGKVKTLVATDKNGNVRYSFGSDKKVTNKVEPKDDTSQDDEKPRFNEEHYDRRINKGMPIKSVVEMRKHYKVSKERAKKIEKQLDLSSVI